jgi:hypothetical protein
VNIKSRIRKAPNILVGLAITIFFGCAGDTNNPPATQDCSDEWLAMMEKQLSITDRQGHGPDIGSLEWRSAIEFKLGIRDDPQTPPPESPQWCNYISQQVIDRGT